MKTFANGITKNLYLVLENIRSVHNVGAILRTAAFFGIKNILLVGYSGRDTAGVKTVLHKNAKKTSMGADESLNIEFLDDSVSLLEFARENLLDVYALEQSPSAVSLQNFDVSQIEGGIFVLGNELEGVSKEVLHNSKAVLQIERPGDYHSLNVTTAAGVLLFWICASHR